VALADRRAKRKALPEARLADPGFAAQQYDLAFALYPE
jgi:hypothetical protein